MKACREISAIKSLRLLQSILHNCITARYAVMVCSILACVALWGTTGMTVQASVGQLLTDETENSQFVIEASKMATSKECYEIQVNVKNMGADWEGTVRLIAVEDYLAPTAYDTSISLPQGSEKQFVVKIPKDSIDMYNGDVKVLLLNKRGKEVAKEEFRYLLVDDADSLSMGILSDNYDKLTYLDMGGDTFYFYGEYYPVKLTELNQGNLVDTLDSLEFLVIDSFNTSILTEEELKAIELWNYDGGVLILGTGSYGEDVLGGFENYNSSYLNVECGEVFGAGETGSYGIVNEYSYVDFSLLPLAEVRDSGNMYYAQYNSSAMTRPMGDGAVGIMPYSLTELADVNESFYMGQNQEVFVMSLLEEISVEASSRYDYSNNYYSYDSAANWAYRMLALVGNSNSSLHFGALKFIVIIYVIFVGPILYLILRAAKKRELYWLFVPVTALAGIVLVFLAGRGFEVVDTRAYTVTTKNLSEPGSKTTYLYCYDANHREWELKLSKGYEYVGDMWNDEYDYYYDEEDDYYHHVKTEGDTIYFGIKPSSNFEDSYFMAMGNDGVDSGNIVSEGVTADWTGLKGIIANETDKDFLYYAVVSNDILYVYENLPAGSVCDLSMAAPIYNSNTSGYQSNIRSAYVYDLLDDAIEERDEDEVSALSALGVGLCAAYPTSDSNACVVIGVTEDWDKTIDDRCSELSYGCLYTVE